MIATIHRMATKPNTDRHKPSRMVRIPEAFAVVLEEMAAEQLNSVTEQVKSAIREHLIRLGRWPVPPKKPPAKARDRGTST